MHFKLKSQTNKLVNFIINLKSLDYIKLIPELIDIRKFNCLSLHVQGYIS